LLQKNTMEVEKRGHIYRNVWSVQGGQWNYIEGRAYRHLGSEAKARKKDVEEKYERETKEKKGNTKKRS